MGFGVFGGGLSACSKFSVCARTHTHASMRPSIHELWSYFAARLAMQPDYPRIASLSDWALSPYSLDVLLVHMRLAWFFACWLRVGGWISHPITTPILSSPSFLRLVLWKTPPATKKHTKLLSLHSFCSTSSFLINIGQACLSSDCVEPSRRSNVAGHHLLSASRIYEVLTFLPESAIINT